MSREYKFRVWKKSIKKYLDFVTLTMDSNGELTAIASFSSLEPDLGKDDYILEQYTGLKDKNGKEIYEGDIVRTEDKLNIKTVCFVVGFEYGGFTPFTNKHPDVIDLDSPEVIGTIHENSELLGGEE